MGVLVRGRCCLGVEDESDGYVDDQPAEVHEEVAASGEVDVLLNHLSKDW
jgi:hypothetical protein